MVLTVDQEAFHGQDQDGFGHLSDDQPVSAETCRRIACDAPVRPVLESPDGTSFQLGRRTRRISLPPESAVNTGQVPTFKILKSPVELFMDFYCPNV